MDVPVTLKIRTGWNPEHRNGVRIAQLAEAAGIASLAVHGRHAPVPLAVKPSTTPSATSKAVSAFLFCQRRYRQRRQSLCGDAVHRRRRRAYWPSGAG